MIMIKNNWFFRVVCRLCVAFLLILASSPLITLAFYTDDETSFLPETIPVVTSQTLEPLEPTKPTETTQITAEIPLANAYYLGDAIADIPPQNKVFYDLFTVAERKSRNLPTALLDVAPYYEDKVVYLTFDDGPNPIHTPIILKILKDNGIKATFFVVGTQVETYPDILKSIYQEGHAIGNHTYNHVYRDLYSSASAYTNQLHHNDDIIKNVIGVRPRISRAPGGSAGSFTKTYWDALKTEGYIEVGWNVSSGDASKAEASQIVNNIMEQMKSDFLWNHTIVLMHDGIGHEETAKALPAIIQFYKEHGFSFRAINQYTPTAW